MKILKPVLMTLIFCYSMFTFANPYVDFNVKDKEDQIIIDFETKDDYFLKDILIKNNRENVEFIIEKENIKIKNKNDIKKLEISYIGCISEYICQERTYNQLEKTIDGWTNNKVKKEYKESVTVVENIQENEYLNYISDPNLILNALEKNSILLNLVFFFLIGILLSFTPCIFPMLPIISSIVIKNNTKNPFLLSSFYTLGIASSYAMIGFIMGMLNLNLQIYFQNIYIVSAVAIFFFLLGYLMISNYQFQIFNKSNNLLNEKSSSIKANSYLSTFIIGFLSSLVISPCAAAPLIGILIYMQTEQHSVTEQILILFSLGLGAGFPLILISSSLKKILPKNGQWMTHIKNLFGMILFGAGIYTFQKITSIDLTGIYLIVVLTYFYYFIKKNHFLYFVFSLLILYGFLIQNDNFEQKEYSESINYIKIENIDLLNQEIKKGKENSKPIFIDIYADWCTVCIRMEKETFDDPEIISILNDNFYSIKIDITKINDGKQEILKEYKLQTAPAYIFYDKNGKKDKNYYVGFLDEEKFLNLLKKQL